MITPVVGRCYRRVWSGNPVRRSPHRWVRKVDADPIWGRSTVWTVLGPEGSPEWLGQRNSRSAHGLDTFRERYIPCDGHKPVLR